MESVDHESTDQMKIGINIIQQTKDNIYTLESTLRVSATANSHLTDHDKMTTSITLTVWEQLLHYAM